MSHFQINKIYILFNKHQLLIFHLCNLQSIDKIKMPEKTRKCLTERYERMKKAKAAKTRRAAETHEKRKKRYDINDLEWPLKHQIRERSDF